MLFQTMIVLQHTIFLGSVVNGGVALPLVVDGDGEGGTRAVCGLFCGLRSTGMAWGIRGDVLATRHKEGCQAQQAQHPYMKRSPITEG